MKNPSRGGPTTAAGKQRSAKNSTKDGLHALNPVSRQEHTRLANLKASLNKQYKPENPTEEIYVDRIANLTLRLERVNNIELSLYDQSREAEIGNFYEVCGFSEEAKMAYCEFMLGTQSKYKKLINGYVFDEIHAPLMKQLWAAQENSIFPRTLEMIKTHIPLLYERIRGLAIAENQSIVDVIVDSRNPVSEVDEKLASMMDFFEEDPDPEIGDESNISAADIFNLSKAVFTRLHENMSIPLMIVAHSKHNNNAEITAMPDTQKLEMINRQITSISNQLSKAIGELHVLIRERGVVQQSTQPRGLDSAIRSQKLPVSLQSQLN